MKITDEKMAKALGWTKGKSPMNSKVTCWFPVSEHKGNDYYFTLPKWITSLDAIVAEIEARGHNWECKRMSSGIHTKTNSVYRATVWNPVQGPEAIGHDGPAACLCEALLAYLKDHPND